MYNPMIHIFASFKNELNELYINSFLRTFALGLVYTFLPIYIISQGFSSADAVLYLFFVYFFLIVLNPMAIFFGQKIGLKHTLLLNIIVTVAYFFCLYTISDLGWPIFFVGMLYAMSVTFYWMPYNTLFAIDSKDGERGKEVGIGMSLEQLAGISSPLLGAFLIEGFGFLVAFFAATLLLVLSVIPLFFTPDRKLTPKHDWSRVFSKEFNRFKLPFLFEGIFFAAFAIWPLYVFLHHEAYMLIGFVSFLAGIGTTAFTYFIGRLSDKVSRKTLMNLGGIFMFFLCLVPLLVGINDVLAMFLSFAFGFFFSLICLPLFAESCEEAHNKSASEFFVFREFYLSVSRCAVFLLVFLLMDFNWIFILAAVASVYFAFFTNK